MNYQGLSNLGPRIKDFNNWNCIFFISNPLFYENYSENDVECMRPYRIAFSKKCCTEYIFVFTVTLDSGYIIMTFL